MNKVYNFLSSIDFSLPEKKKYLIFDNHSKVILDYLKFKNNFYILDTRGEKYYFYFLLKCILNFNFKNIKINYYKYLIDHINPSIIINYTFNDYNFYLLKKFFKKKIFISIQNGFLNNDLFESLKKKKSPPSSDYIFSFGTGVSKLINKYINSQVIVYGSIKNNFNPKKLLVKKKKKLVLISGFWQYPDSKNILLKNYYNSELKILPKIFSLCRKYNFELVIFSRSGTAEEKLFYRKLLKSYNFKFFKNVNKFTLSDEYEYFIGFNSTLTLEILSRGHKVIIFNTRKNNFEYPKHNLFFPNMSIPNKGYFWTDKINYIEIERLFRNLLSSNNNIWSFYAKKFIPSLIKFSSTKNDKLLDLLKS